MSRSAFQHVVTQRHAIARLRLRQPLAGRRDHPLATLLHAGNRATQLASHMAFIQRKCACGSGGSSPCKCDEYEQEADRVAEPVMRMPIDVATTRSPSVQRHVAAGGRTGAVATGELEARLAEAKTHGVPLEPDVRATLEPHFGSNLAAVRIHTGAAAAEVSGDLNALAFTQGRDVYFARGKFNPGTLQGRRLLAHEITHVVQQTGGGAEVGDARIARQPDEADAGQLNEPPPYPKAMAATEQEYYDKYLRDCAGIRRLERLTRNDLTPLEQVERFERRMRRLPIIIKAREAYKEENKKPPSRDKPSKIEGPLRQMLLLHLWDKNNIEPEFGQDYMVGSLEHELAVAQCELSRAWWEYMVSRRGGRLPGERRLRRQP